MCCARRWGGCAICTRPQLHADREAARPRDIGQKRARRADNRRPIKVVPRNSSVLGSAKTHDPKGGFFYGTTRQRSALPLEGEGT